MANTFAGGLPGVEAWTFPSDVLDGRFKAFLEKLPVLSESDITALGHKESTCPICFLPLVAVIAEEEMAQAMDSPAHAAADLGVTRLQSTCGHIFCRKDLSKWIHEGKRSCPMCRTPFLPLATTDNLEADTADQPDGGEAPEAEYPPLSMVLAQLIRRTQFEMYQADATHDDEEDRREFSGMYS